MLYEGKLINNYQEVRKMVGEFYTENPYAPCYVYHPVGEVQYGKLEVKVSTINKGTATKLEYGSNYILVDEKSHVIHYSASKKFLDTVVIQGTAK